MRVAIYGRSYTLRGSEDARELRRLAALVDRRMREIAPDPASADELKVAILAALNFADEADKQRCGSEEREERIEMIAGRLNTLLTEHLGGMESTEGGEGPMLDAPARSQ